MEQIWLQGSRVVKAGCGVGIMGDEIGEGSAGAQRPS